MYFRCGFIWFFVLWRATCSNGATFTDSHFAPCFIFVLLKKKIVVKKKKIVPPPPLIITGGPKEVLSLTLRFICFMFGAVQFSNIFILPFCGSSLSKSIIIIFKSVATCLKKSC